MSMVEARTALNWDPVERIVLFCGGTEPVAKGLDLVHAAVAQAEKRVGSLRLVILDGTIPSEKIPVYLNAADCLVLASYNEGSPNIVKEALACNLPVAAVDVGDVAERLEGVYPSKVTKRDATEFGRALADVLGCLQRSNGRSKVLSLSEEKIAGEILSIYVDAIRQSKGSSAE
jgi:glycosyltransferase involved in cell wall biosynthesis